MLSRRRPRSAAAPRVSLKQTLLAAGLPEALARGEDPPSGLVEDEIDNGQKQVPSVLLTPVAVTKDNIDSTIVKDDFWTVKQICTPQYAAACKQAGIQ